MTGSSDENAASEPADAVLIDVVDERILIITLNRPRVKNAIDSALSEGLAMALQTLDDRDDLRVGVLTGAGDTFCAGMDLKAFARFGKPRGIRTLLREGTKKPLVAAVEGVALGGGLELALLADLVVAASDAKLGLPEARVGLFPSGGALQRLQGILPRTVIAELVFTGERMTAGQAHTLGLVSRLTEPGDVLKVAIRLAELITRCAPLGVAASKELLRAVPRTSTEDFWRRQGELADAIAQSHDAHEGAKAFAEKRDPVWRNR
ncbi:crotonase/enoyl-CoA hydratase family protein [Mycolicibacterium stellerae]|uniref:crotonase/enoyl-CoA hydratase family protein n=1 Tax=Mycolicibacterium stellerae TaxID=2358193 RepID=UPI000F0B7D05|nr:crotonase/enoyl-CoA hydratase family protein [Mycolicibacterium stellerae]